MLDGGGEDRRTLCSALALFFFRHALAPWQRAAYVEGVGGVDGLGGVFEFLHVGDVVGATEGGEVE